MKDRNRVTDLFSNDFFNDRPDKPKSKNRNKGRDMKPPAMLTNKLRFEQKFSEELFSEFDEKDWFQYFVMKARENGVHYLRNNYIKDYVTIKSILGTLSWTELKLMIDFLWDSDQDIQPKQTMGIWILSKGWINTIYQNSLLWRDGKYHPKNAPSHNREWIAEASKKTDKSSKETTPKRKRNINIGWDD